MTVRVSCPRCGCTQAVNLKTNPLRMWPHGWCVNVLAPLGIGRSALVSALEKGC